MGKYRLFVLILLAALLVLPGPGQAGKRDSGKKRAPEKSGQTIEPSGLSPVFYGNAACPRIASAYGDRSRYDGSLRPAFRYGGRHGGIDLSLEPGTVLLAMAAGTVVHTGAGGQMEGNFLWLLHLPEDTGLDTPVLTKYQHLDTVPAIAPGTRVAAGQPIARSGSTGTHGGHYGQAGYPHLHLSAMKSRDGRFEIQDGTFSVKGRLVDPLELFEVRDRETGRVTVPVVTPEGRILPPGARVVWPVACR